MGAADDDVAVLVFREDGRWQAERLPPRLNEDLDGLVDVLRAQPSEGGAMVFVDVEGEFFVALRQGPFDIAMLISDVTAGVASDLASQVLDELDLPIPEEDELDDVWPAGDLSMFADIGLEEMELGAILADTEAYADEMLLVIARRCGFLEQWRDVVDGALR